MKTVTLTPEQITRILHEFSYGKSNHVPCPRGCCWETKPVEDYIPDFISENNSLLTIEIEDTQIKNEETYE